jgi:hypothetical protein
VKEFWFYDVVQSGLGRLPHSVIDVVAREGGALKFLKVCLLAIVVFNALRYFWSAFLVESLPSFHKVRKNLHAGWRATEWILRLACISVLFAIPIGLTQKAQNFEILLIFLYVLLLAWDILMYVAVTYGQVQDEKFRRSVKIWLIIEFFGFLFSLAYLAIVKFLGPENPLAASISIGGLAAFFLVIGLIDFVTHWEQYWAHGRRLIVGMMTGSIVAMFLIWTVTP